MISFIVIGKNEGWKLSKCFDSIINAVEQNQIEEYEIIYVDSCSTDDSIEIAKKIPGTTILSVTGKCNAAIGRNVGGKEAQGDILFFLDGDMELKVDFVASIFDINGIMIHPAITGVYYHWFYDKGWNLIDNALPSEVAKSYFQIIIGGFFVIERALWRKVTGMDARLNINEDFDFGLRLAQCGIHILNVGQIAVIHHTLMSHSRNWHFLLNYRYAAFLARKHFTNVYYWKKSLRMNYSAIILFISLIGLFVSPYSLFIYLFILFLRSISKGATYFPQRLQSFIIRDVVFLTALAFYYPNPTKESYIRL